MTYGYNPATEADSCIQSENVTAVFAGINPGTTNWVENTLILWEAPDASPFMFGD